MIYTFTGLQAAGLKNMLSEIGFKYQQRWFISQKRIRHITKTRQCGADWYFSLEALIDAIETGRSQYFLTPNSGCSLSWNRDRIVHFASLVGVDIEPDDLIRLHNGAEIRFFGEGSSMACFHGNAYVSEYAWADNPRRLFLAGRSLSMHSKYRFTAYTSPSESTEAFRLWQLEKPENRQRLSAEDARLQGSVLLNTQALTAKLSSAEFEPLYSAVWPHERTAGAA
ncbi:hypothetical protein EHW64_16715 [Erwinia psidii]|uniref:terminase large subunit domain-containing protein n=1 Tax=Erwinia psidii TaxID=69224 RepID=UPI00226B6A60|nr:terminase family protein [Erwinia psidii]MCX8962718.1 hypothetical protein [Erwinia psidii]